jgi:hypothetical protein
MRGGVHIRDGGGDVAARAGVWAQAFRLGISGILGRDEEAIPEMKKPPRVEAAQACRTF